MKLNQVGERAMRALLNSWDEFDDRMKMLDEADADEADAEEGPLENRFN